MSADKFHRLSVLLGVLENSVEQVLAEMKEVRRELDVQRPSTSDNDKIVPIKEGRK